MPSTGYHPSSIVEACPGIRENCFEEEVFPFE
jgi:hypothetical protein